tara:strand:+ start:1386 stop:1727 length:342 start_codon:yes stop_codon:yes gene_type:complete
VPLGNGGTTEMETVASLTPEWTSTSATLQSGTDESEKCTSRCEYVLYGVCMHSGSTPNGGHYFSYARESEVASTGGSENDEGVRGGDCDAGAWWRFDDSHVRKIDSTSLLQEV